MVNEIWKIKPLFLLIIIFLYADNRVEQDSLTRFNIALLNLKEINKIAENCRFSNPSKSIEYCQEAVKLISDTCHPYDIAKAWNNIGNCYFDIGDFYKAYTYYVKERDQLSKSGLSLASAYNSIGYVYNKMNMHELAGDNFKKAHREIVKYTDQKQLINSYINIGNAFYYLEKYDSALTYFNYGQLICEKSGKKLECVKLYNNIGLTYLSLKDYRRALNSFEKVRIFSEIIEDDEVLAETYHNLSKLYNAQKESETALYYLSKAYSLYEKLNERMYMFDILVDIGNVYLEGDDIDTAFKNGEKALKLSSENQQHYDMSKLYKLLSDVYLKSENFRDAFTFSQKYLSKRDSIVNESIYEHMFMLKLFEKDKDHFRALHSKNQMIQDLKQNRLYIFFLFTLIVLSTYVFLMFYFKRKKISEKELKEKMQNLEREKNILNENIEQQVKKLTTNAMNTVEKNEMLMHMTSDIKKMIQENKRNGNNYVITKQLDNLISQINSHISNDYWDEFNVWFNKTSQSFLNTLSLKHPQLTKKDLEVCALIKLGLNTKEIAHLLFQEPASINKKRYRIRKKIGLQNSDSLFQYLQNL